MFINGLKWGPNFPSVFSKLFVILIGIIEWMFHISQCCWIFPLQLVWVGFNTHWLTLERKRSTLPRLKTASERIDDTRWLFVTPVFFLRRPPLTMCQLRKEDKKVPDSHWQHVGSFVLSVSNSNCAKCSFLVLKGSYRRNMFRTRILEQQVHKSNMDLQRFLRASNQTYTRGMFAPLQQIRRIEMCFAVFFQKDGSRNFFCLCKQGER